MILSFKIKFGKVKVSKIKKKYPTKKALDFQIPKEPAETCTKNFKDNDPDNNRKMHSSM